MLARDIMTTSVVTVALETGIEEIVKLLLERQISAVPVVDANDRILGIVSEGDLMRRPETGTERRPSWWLALMASDIERAHEYLKTHGRRAEDVMTRDVITVGDDASANEIAGILEKHRIKRVPVVREGRLVGIVSRANLLHGLASQPQPPAAAAAADDRTIREQVSAELQGAGWVTEGNLNIIVTDGVVQLWGTVGSDEERRAIVVAAEGVPGVREVEDHLGTMPPFVWSA